MLPRQQIKRQTGQISILVGLMMTTFMFFFAFVLNTGMLVNAKINLQNAADLAAYAGASVQARQLNSISYLNYEMRRQYKKFLFRYYVLGTMAQASAPTDANDLSSRRRWLPDNQPAHDYQVPGVCVMFKANDNYCQLHEQPGISIPTAATATFDAIQRTLIEQLRQLETIRAAGCERMGATNSYLLGLWLYNLDPTLEGLMTNSTPEIRDSAGVLRALAQGLGLIPKLMILKKRIETLNYYVNFAPQTGVTKAIADGLNATGDVNARERTVQAFLSAYGTLGPNTFSDTTAIQMDELMPANGDEAKLLSLKPITVSFDTYAVAYTPPAGGQGTCTSSLTPLVIKGLIPIGVQKNNDTLTYYAIRLRAKAKLLFTPSPWGDLTLTAYSAAQPFGSRIGPQFADNEVNANFTTTNPLAGLAAARVTFGETGFLPNLPILENDSAANGGFLLNGVQATLMRATGLTGDAAGGTEVSANISADDMNFAIHSAMAPNPWEASKYNIIGTQGPDDRYQDGFDEARAISMIWAPIYTKDKSASLTEAMADLNQLINEFSTPANPSTSQSAVEGVGGQAFKDKLKQSLSQYFQKLDRGLGDTEDGETRDVAVLKDPYRFKPSNGPMRTVTTSSPRVTLTDYTKIRSSWTPNENEPRTGYSVKFIPLKNLMSPQGLSTSDKSADAWTNLPAATDEQLQEDLQKVSH